MGHMHLMPILISILFKKQIPHISLISVRKQNGRGVPENGSADNYEQIRGGLSGSRSAGSAERCHGGLVSYRWQRDGSAFLPVMVVAGSKRF